MTFKHTLIALGLAAGAMGAAPAAFAQAHATLGPWTYQLIDLNPNDDSTPVFTFTESSRSGAVKVFDTSGGEPAASASITSGGTASASFNGTATATSLPESISASVDMTNGSGSAVADVDYSFSLSGNTLLILSVPATVGGGFHNFAGEGDAIARLSGAWVTDTSPHTPYLTFESSLNSPGLIGGGSATLSGAVNTEDPVFGHLYLHASAAGRSGISPVPEPASVAMLVAGLALLGGAARRRGRTTPAPRG